MLRQYDKWGYESNAPSPMGKLVDVGLVPLASNAIYNPVGISKSLDEVEPRRRYHELDDWNEYLGRNDNKDPLRG